MAVAAAELADPTIEVAAVDSAGDTASVREGGRS